MGEARERTVEGWLTTAIPEGTRLLGITIEDGIASVDLSMTARVAQVVFTMTQFAQVDEPLGRDVREIPVRVG